MSADQFTPWFPPSTAPKRVGVYQAMWSALGGVVFYSYWNGKRWNSGWYTADRARSNARYGSDSPTVWRGLAADPKEPA